MHVVTKIIINAIVVEEVSTRACARVCMCETCNFSDSILVISVLLNMKSASLFTNSVNTTVVAVSTLKTRLPFREYDLCLQRRAYP
jgi:hypothetical protein